MNVRATSHVGWLTARTGYVPPVTARAIAAFDSHNEIAGMVVYDDWAPASVRMHFALDTVGAARAVLVPAFAYPFRECGKTVVWGVIASHNKRSLKLAQHLGFREVYRVKNGWNEGSDLVHLEMRAEECRWLRARRKD